MIHSMMTIFSCPKPFRGHINVIQRNAIHSWTLIRPEPEIILIGNEEGTADICREFNLRHIPEVKRNKYGTPLLNDIFEKSEKAAANDLLCYINTDIILMNDFMRATHEVAQCKNRFLMVGQRWMIDIKEPLDFEQNNWEYSLRSIVLQQGHPDIEKGIDYFVYTRGLYDTVPPFALGRTVFDNWLIYHARSRWVPVVDASPVVMAVHQNHDYSHHPLGHKGVWEGPETRYNFRLAGGRDYLLRLDDRTHVLSPRGLKLDISPIRLCWHFRRLPILVAPFQHPLLSPIRKVWQIFPPLWRLFRRLD